MKTFYDVLGVDRGAPVEEIKRAFRREIARYHPDKVQHLGAEFQELASTRAAELTEAYRVLMDEEARQTYDAELTRPDATRAEGAAASGAAAPAPAARAEPPQAPPPRAAGRRDVPRSASDVFVKKAALALLADAVAEVMPAAVPASARGFDAVYGLSEKRSLFGRTTPGLRLLARFVPQVDRAAIDESWPLGQAAAGAETACLLVLGAGLAPAKDLSAAVAEQRRKTRSHNLLLVPVDVRDWEALFPPETPAPVRAVLQRLREGRR